MFYWTELTEHRTRLETVYHHKSKEKYNISFIYYTCWQTYVKNPCPDYIL